MMIAVGRMSLVSSTPPVNRALGSGPERPTVQKFVMRCFLRDWRP